MIYLDNNATTRLDPVVAESMARLSSQVIGNPGSRHAAGRRARQLLEDSRDQLAVLLGARSDEVIFTSGGTESNNLAIFGLTAGRQGAVVLPRGEHPSIEEPVHRLARHGCTPRWLPLDAQGEILASAQSSWDPAGVLLATCVLAHNETGAIRELTPLLRRCRELSIPSHIDVVQAVGKMEVNFAKLQATTLSLAAHKFHGPRGIGALLVRKGTRLQAQLFGGHQEQGFRPGTEPVLLAAGMAQALSRWHDQRMERTARITRLRDRLQAGLVEQSSPAIVNGDPASRLPNTLNIAFPGCTGDLLLIALDLAGICCSLGSACASGSTEPSPLLVAMGLPDEVVRSSIRLSLSDETTADEVEIAIDRISAVVHRQRQPISSR